MDLVDHSVDRVLDLIGLADEKVRRWEGDPGERERQAPGSLPGRARRFQ